VGKLVEATLRKVAILATLVIVASFLVFALHQANGASQVQQSIVTPTEKASATQGESAPHRWLDDAADALLTPVSPFAPGTSDSWGYRLFDLAVGVLLWGVLLGAFARSLGLNDRRRRDAVSISKPQGGGLSPAAAAEDPWSDARF
jgi:hypothetical protein